MYAFVFTLANYRIQRLGISRMRAALKRNCLISGKIDMSTPVYILCVFFLICHSILMLVIFIFRTLYWVAISVTTLSSGA